jgi:hypothetical protein
MGKLLRIYFFENSQILYFSGRNYMYCKVFVKVLYGLLRLKFDERGKLQDLTTRESEIIHQWSESDQALNSTWGFSGYVGPRI